MKARIVALGVFAVLSLLVGAFAAAVDGGLHLPTLVLYSGVLFLSLALFFVALPRMFSQPVQIFVAMVLGVSVGGLLDALGHETLVVDYLGIFGTLFILLLKMVVIPLVFVSIVSGMAGIEDVRRVGTLGAKTLAYYFSTTAVAVLLGMVWVNLVQPGAGRSELTRQLTEAQQQEEEQASFGRRIQDEFLPAVVPGVNVARIPILPIIFAALILGIALAANGARSQGATSFFLGLNEGIMTIVTWIMALAPVGVYALMAVAVASMGMAYLATLATYVLTVILALASHFCFLTLVLVPLIARISPLRFLRAMSPALQLAFSTSSSSATLPVTIESAVDRLGVGRTVASFMLPLGATINMDGTALYQAVASIFIAEVYGVSLAFHQQLMIFLTAVLVSVGAAGIPGASVGMMVIVLASAGLPVEGIGIILGVDRFLDMCRTFVNVTGDSVGATVVARTEGELDPTFGNAERSLP